MRNIVKLGVLLALLAAQVNVPKANFGNVAAADGAPASTASVYEVKLNTTADMTPVSVLSPVKPDYSTDVLAPLHTAETEAAAQAAAQAAARAAAAAAEAARLAAQRQAEVVVVESTNDVWGALRACESGGDYTRDTGNGYYGAYQFTISTWGDFMGYPRPDLAPPTVQDAKAHATQAARGWAPWPACAQRLGLL